jgi:predicted dinucleotide-utilizing enzyme
MQKVGIGIIGCGNISGAYLKAMASFPILDIKGVADMNADMAKAKAEEFKVAARSVDDLLADPEIEIIVNLTIPKAHVEVGLRALDAAVIKPRGPSSIKAFLARQSAERRHSCARDTNAGTLTPPSTTKSAADRCWTWDPITLPTSSTSLDPSPRWQALPFRHVPSA